MIVDSPGVGETEEFDTMVYQYIPEVFAFIYVISLANSDGIQKDTVSTPKNSTKKISLYHCCLLLELAIVMGLKIDVI